MIPKYIAVISVSFIFSKGLNHIAGIISSIPNTEPYIRPKNMEDAPILNSSPPKSLFFLFSISPAIAKTAPWPRSPNIDPKSII